MSDNYPQQTIRQWGSFATTSVFPGVAAAEINLQNGDLAYLPTGVMYWCLNAAVTPALWLPVGGGGPLPFKAITFADSTFVLSMNPTAAGFAPIGGTLQVDTSGGNVVVELPTAAALGANPLVILECLQKVTTDASTIQINRAGGATYKIQNVAGNFAWALSSSPGFPYIKLVWDGANVWVR